VAQVLELVVLEIHHLYLRPKETQVGMGEPEQPILEVGEVVHLRLEQTVVG